MTEIQQVTDGIWFFPPDPDPDKIQPSVGVICTEKQTVLVDAGNGPPHARRIMAALQQIDAPPVSHIIYTHSHWDHIFGACAWKVPVIAHDTCAKLVREMAAIDYLEQLKVENPARIISANAMSDWDNFEIIIPQVIFFENTHTLTPDGLTISLEWVGGNHSPDSTIVRIPERGVMFLGDCFYPPPGQQSNVDWAMLRGLVEDPIAFFIDGHSGLSTRTEAEAILSQAFSS
jgi:glyoxylase-like metal-dependent hydrolase (beta-lactamase superfamily II)